MANTLKTLLVLAGSCLLTQTACVNQIESETEVTEGKIPITFSLKINKTDTRVTNESFDEGDKIGLYGMLSGNAVDEERYINNLSLTYIGDNKLVPEKVVFYPEGDIPLDFISYYPYSEAGASEGSSMIPVSIQTEQNKAENYSASDFMTAETSEVYGSEEAVELEFNHQFTRLKLSLKPGEGVDVEDMLEDNPRLIATGFYTEADYDLIDHTFTNFAKPTDIQSAGEWEVEDGKLTGLEFILLPQPIDGNQMLQMEWNGRVYTCPLPDIDELENNKQYNLEINSIEEESYVMSGIVVSINQWGEGDALDQVDNSSGSKALHLSVLSFDVSNIYRVYLDGKEVAEICKEYLISDELTSTAITAYPVNNEGEANLTQGMVLQLLDVDENINGGTIRWNKEENAFTYTKGNLPPVQRVYFDAQGKICLEKPEESAEVNVVAHTLRDLRQDLEEYPIVKVGTQYWMRNNLKATHYRGGKALTSQPSLSGIAGYFYVDKYVLYFYNGEALLDGNLAPDGWRIPSLDDWHRLDDYVGGDMALLKAGVWEFEDEYAGGESEVQPATNETMFNLRASGMWQTSGFKNAKQLVGFWSWDYEKDTIPEKTVFFIGQVNTMTESSTKSSGNDFYKGLAIRCLLDN